MLQKRALYHLITLLLLGSGILIFQATAAHAQGTHALQLDGVNDYVNLGDIPFSVNSLTLEAWIRTSNSKARNVFLHWGNTGGGDRNVEFRLNEGKLNFLIANNSPAAVGQVIGTTNIADGKWHHVAVSKDNSAVVLYIDGRQEASGTISVSPALNRCLIGALFYEGSFASDAYFDGDIDEVRIWNSVRTQTQIQAQMNELLAGNESGLVALYSMTDGSGTSLTDNSVNSYDGAFVDGPVWQASGAMKDPFYGLEFDGADQCVLANMSGIIASSSLTIEFWAYFNTLTGHQNPLRIDNPISANGLDDPRIVVTKRGADNRLEMFVRDDDGVTVSVSDYTVTQVQTWLHFAWVYDRGTVIFYVNGEEVWTQSGVRNFTMPTSPRLSLGADYFTSSNIGFEFNGRLDEVRLWSDVRTADEIRAFKNRTLDGNEANLIAYYRLDQTPASGHSTAFDNSPNNNHGTLLNMDPSTDWVVSAPFNTWIGSEDSNWGTASNWSRSVVPSTEDVGIYSWAGSVAPATSNISARNFFLNSGATLSHSGNLTLSGDFLNNGTFSTTGDLTFSGSAAQTIRGSGTTTVGTLVVNNSAGVTMAQNLTINTGLTLTSGTLSIGANTLTLNGSITQTSGSLTGGSTSNLTVGGSGSSLSIPALTLNNLTINRSNGASLSGAVTVDGTLTLTSGVLDVGSSMLTLGNSASIAGTPGASAHVRAASGTLRKNYAGTGSFLFPVGDGATYSPITLNFTAGSFSSGAATVSVTNAKHPHNASASHFLNRYWSVSSSGITGFSCDVSAQYADADISGTETLLNGAKYSSGEWMDLGSVTPASNLITGTVSGFSDFTAGESTAFPVEWLDFSASRTGSTVRLDWATASEANNDYFAIERSADREHWSGLGQVEAIGPGNAVQTYRFDDLQPLAGKTWYRLRQVDMDGGFSYSQVVEVSEAAEVGLKTWPNPVKDQLHLALKSGEQVTAILTDASGRVVWQQALASGSATVAVDQLPAGVYFLRVYGEAGMLAEQKIMKE